MTNEDAIKWLDNLKNDLGNPHYECLWPYAQAIEEICELLKAQEPIPCGEKIKAGDVVLDFYECGIARMRFANRGDIALFVVMR